MVGVHEQNVHGDTALHLSGYGPGADATELLISRGADVNARNERGKTPLDEISEYAYDGSAKRQILKEHGAKE